MLDLLASIRLAPSTLYFIGHEDAFMDLLDPLVPEIERFLDINVEFARSEVDVVLNLFEAPPSSELVVVFGLLSYLAAQKRADPQSLAKVVCALSNSGRAFVLGDVQDCPFLDQLLPASGTPTA